MRSRIIALASGTLIIHVMPAQVDIEKIVYKHRTGTTIVVTDGSGWSLDLSHL